MEKKVKTIHYAAIFAVLVLLASAPTQAEYDGGVSADGTVVICSPTMSLRCGLSSKDAEEPAKIIACLDTIASDMYGSPDYKPSDINELRDKIIHECSNHYLKLAIRYKAEAGDYEDKGKEQGFLEFQTDTSGQNSQETAVAASNTQNVVKLTELRAAVYMMKSLKDYFTNLANRDLSQIAIDNGGRTVEDTAEGGNNG